MIHIRKKFFKKVNDPGTTAHPRAHTHKLTHVWTWELSQNEVKVDHVAALSDLVVSYSSWPHGLQQARPPCPSPSHRVCPSSCSLHWWCRPAIASSDALFSFFPQSFPASRTSPVSHLFASDDQNTGASAAVLPVNIQGWPPLRLTVLILLSRGFSGVLSSPTVQRHQFFGILPLRSRDISTSLYCGFPWWWSPLLGWSTNSAPWTTDYWFLVISG